MPDKAGVGIAATVNKAAPANDAAGRARATIARFDPRRQAICAAYVLSQVDRPLCVMTVVAWHRACQRLTSPALVIPAGPVARPRGHPPHIGQ